jgi:hypothetical protein
LIFLLLLLGYDHVVLGYRRGWWLGALFMLKVDAFSPSFSFASALAVDRVGRCDGRCWAKRRGLNFF